MNRTTNKKEIVVMTYEQWKIIHKKKQKRKIKRIIKKIYNKLIEYFVYSIMVTSPILLVIIWLLFGY